ncbi:MAG TPA: Gfo/Idh/MocA family oxidoreductase [Thermoguttaceae bacterium]|nr:Gfo/Idh/MocA family oxidoreductase [Thermoguttaceae bacterium]
MVKRLTRREMLAGTASAGAAAWLAGGISTLGAGPAPSERLNVAFIGSGGQAAFSLEHLADHNIVALCDVDERRAAGAFERFPKAKRFRDYRRMLDQMERQIDAVVVATPDHTHAPASIRAMQLGKHVYCEKPLTWCIEEARRMAETAKRHNVATQMGTQGVAMDGARAGIEVIRAGAIGAVREMHVWTDRAEGWWPQGIDRPREKPPVPKGLDWDLWLGVAPPRPYHPAYVPFKWRGWLDFGTGALGDMGIHNAAMAWVGLELGLPRSVEVVATSGINRETFPAWSILRLEFPARGPLPPVTMHWYDGGKRPSADLIGGREVAKNGAILVGEQGTMYSIEWTGADWHLFPEDRFGDYQPPEPSLSRSPGHHAEWIAACKGGPAAFCNFIDFAAPLTEVMLLGNLALRTGQKIEWDAQAMRAKGRPEADELIRRAYRKGRDV